MTNLIRIICITLIIGIARSFDGYGAGIACGALGCVLMLASYYDGRMEERYPDEPWEEL